MYRDIADIVYLLDVLVVVVHISGAGGGGREARGGGGVEICSN